MKINLFFPFALGFGLWLVSTDRVSEWVLVLLVISQVKVTVTLR